MNDKKGSSQTTTTTTSTSTGTTTAHGSTIPWATWVIGGAALVVVLTAGVLLAGKSKKEPESSVTAGQTQEAQESDLELELDQVHDLAPKNPLNISATLLDAQERAKVWSRKAMLSRIDLVIENGAPKGPVMFEFGESVGQPVPGGPLGALRYSISYEGDQVSSEEEKSAKQRIALQEPNCPLDVAFRKLLQSGAGSSGPVGALYVNSTKHRRPVWMMTTTKGEAFSMSADSCAMLRR